MTSPSSPPPPAPSFDTDPFDALFGGGGTGDPADDLTLPGSEEVFEVPHGPAGAPAPPPAGGEDANPFEAPHGPLHGAPSHAGIDLDLTFAASALHGGRAAVREAVARGVVPDRLSGDGRRVFEFTLAHLGEYGITPTVDQVLARLALALPDAPPDGPTDFWAREILNRTLQTELQVRIGDWTARLEARRPQDAFDEIQAWVRSQSLAFAPVTVDSVGKHLGSVRERYLLRKSGKTGILPPWTTVNRLTYGIYPEQVWLIVARSGVGKTWSAIAIAHAAWVAGHRVLFATTEMSQLAIVQRFAAFHLQLPYHLFNAGRLPPHLEAAFFEFCDTFQDDERLKLVGGDFDFKPATYEAAIEKAQPELSILDGAYLLKGEGKTRFDQAAEAFNEVQRIGRRQKVGQVLTSQYNRDAKAEDAKSGAQEKVALADAAVWNSTVIMGLAQTKDMRRDRVAQARLLKNREGPLGDLITLDWDFDAMNFGEQRPDREGPADDFSTGIEGPAPPLDHDPFAGVGPAAPTSANEPIF